MASGDKTTKLHEFDDPFQASFSTHYLLLKTFYFSSFSDGGEYAMRMGYIKCDIASLSTEKLQFL